MLVRSANGPGAGNSYTWYSVPVHRIHLYSINPFYSKSTPGPENPFLDTHFSRFYTSVCRFPHKRDYHWNCCSRGSHIQNRMEPFLDHDVLVLCSLVVHIRCSLNAQSYMFSCCSHSAIMRASMWCVNVYYIYIYIYRHVANAEVHTVDNTYTNTCILV